MVRFWLLLLLLLLSLLCVFPAPTYRLWHAAILATEFPWVFMVCTLALLPWKGNRRWWWAGTLTGIAALALYLRPVVLALGTGSRLKADLTQAFGPAATRATLSPPYRLSRMVTGIGERQLPFRTLVYQRTEGRPVTLDFHTSGKGGPAPCIIVVHGGSWSSGDSRQLPDWNSYLARQGYRVAAINYRLSPRYTSPAQVADIRAALQYLKRHQGELGIDTHRLVLMGRSAGAQLAMMVAYDGPDPGIRGVIGFYGPADMVWGYSKPANPLVMDSRKVMEDFLGGTYAQAPRQYLSSSPIEAVTGRSAPTLLIHGKNDALVAYEHSTRLSAKMKALGVPHYLLRLSWATHGCDYTLNGPSGQLSVYAVTWFLERVTRQEQGGR